MDKRGDKSCEGKPFGTPCRFAYEYAHPTGYCVGINNACTDMHLASANTGKDIK